MKQRPIKKQESILIQHLIKLIPGQKSFELPQTVCDMDDGGLQSIRMASSSQAIYSHDLIQVKYLDDDNSVVLITLSESNMKELFELAFWKVYSNKLITYPTPEKVTLPSVASLVVNNQSNNNNF